MWPCLINIRALLSDGALKCWGKNDRGQCGAGHSNVVATASAMTVDLDKILENSKLSFRPGFVLLQLVAAACCPSQVGLGITDNTWGGAVNQMGN